MFCIVFISFLMLGASDEDNLKDIFVFPKDRKSSLLPRVKGGENASPHLYPYQAALYITTKKMSRFFCGGTLIDTNWILTAAHCVVDSFLYVSVYLGSHNLADKREVSRQVYYTSKVFVHENWRPFQNDIALIKLLENAILNDYVSLVNISTTNETYAGENSIIIGWGATETAARSNILKKVEVLVMSNDQCKSINENYKSVIKDTHLCTASLDVKGSCKGDSGGPLIVNNKQIGIVSFGSVSCIKPSVFTRVSKFSDWITYTMQNDSSKLSAQIILLPLLISFSICIGF